MSVRAARARFEEAEAHQRSARPSGRTAADRLEVVRGELLEALEVWLAGLEQLPVDDGFADELAALIARAGEPGAPAARDAVRDRAGARRAASCANSSPQSTAARMALAAEREPLDAEHAQTVGSRGPGARAAAVPNRRARRPARSAALGARRLR